MQFCIVRWGTLWLGFKHGLKKEDRHIFARPTRDLCSSDKINIAFARLSPCHYSRNRNRKGLARLSPGSRSSERPSLPSHLSDRFIRKFMISWFGKFYMAHDSYLPSTVYTTSHGQKLKVVHCAIIHTYLHIIIWEIQGAIQRWIHPFQSWDLANQLTSRVP